MSLIQFVACRPAFATCMCTTCSCMSNCRQASAYLIRNIRRCMVIKKIVNDCVLQCWRVTFFFFVSWPVAVQHWRAKCASLLFLIRYEEGGSRNSQVHCNRAIPTSHYSFPFWDLDAKLWRANIAINESPMKLKLCSANSSQRDLSIYAFEVFQ